MQNTCPSSPACASSPGSASQLLSLTAAHLADRLQGSIAGFLRASDQNLGHLETQVAHHARELLRQATQTAAQQKADATPLRCPVCGQPLSRGSSGHARTFETRFGSITVRRARALRRQLDAQAAALPHAGEDVTGTEPGP